MLSASSLYMLELCMAMQPFVEACGRAGSPEEPDAPADDLYEDRMEYWNAMHHDHIYATVCVLCFAGRMPYDNKLLSSCDSPHQPQSARGSDQQSPGWSSASIGLNGPFHGLQQAAAAPLSIQKALRPDDDHHALRLPLSLRMTIAQDAVTALRYRADGGLHADGHAAMQTLDALESTCHDLLASNYLLNSLLFCLAC